MNSSYVLQFRDVQIDVLARVVTVAGEEVHLTRTEFDLLRALSDHPRLALGRTQLLTLVWGGSWRANYHALSVHISNLRKKIGDRTRIPPLIQTIHGFGYRFDAEAVRANGVQGVGLDGQLQHTVATAAGAAKAVSNSAGLRAGGLSG